MTLAEWRRRLKRALSRGPEDLRRLYRKSEFCVFDVKDRRKVDCASSWDWPRIAEHLRQEFRRSEGLPSAPEGYKDKAAQIMRYLWRPAGTRR
jgi:hypothetical protein